MAMRGPPVAWRLIPIGPCPRGAALCDAAGDLDAALYAALLDATCDTQRSTVAATCDAVGDLDAVGDHLRPATELHATCDAT